MPRDCVYWCVNKLMNFTWRVPVIIPHPFMVSPSHKYNNFLEFNPLFCHRQSDGINGVISHHFSSIYVYETFGKCDATKRLPSSSKLKDSILRHVNLKFNKECSLTLMVWCLQSYHFNILYGTFCECDAGERIPSLSKFKDTIFRNVNLKFNKECSQIWLVSYL